MRIVFSHRNRGVAVAALTLLAGIATAPAMAADIEPYRAKTITPYQSREVRPYRGPTVQPTRPARGIHVLTPQERAAMLRNDEAAGRTRSSMSGRGANPASGGVSCAPNCGYDYSTGRSAPTLYNPNYNYSGYGR